ncbi:MAG: FlgD immunoglobulin-like domain containing protein [bacterium]|nr:FlgD immunoglobulin-like domain containing protein [bacterium]
MKYFFVFLAVIVVVAVSLADSTIKGSQNPVEMSAPPFNYAIVVKSSTLEDSSWAAVVDTLQARHEGVVFTHTGNVWDVQSALSTYRPTHICFVAKVSDITSVGSTEYVRRIHQLTRALDDDPYGDAVWAILTGYVADDAMRIATTPSLTISNILLKDCGGLLNYVRQGMYFACHVYGMVWVKRPDCDTIEKYTDGPQDCTDTMVTLLNTNTFDLVMPGGHGSHDTWQLHYPSPGYEGYFRSSNGQVYGDPYTGSNINVNSTNPKVFFAPYNCNHGQILGSGSFVPSWAHTGGVIGYWGSTIPVATVYMKGHGYLWPEQGLHTWAESFYITNQALLFCMEYHVPGTNYSEMNRERDVWGWYGEPSCDIRFDPVMEPNFRREFIINGDTVTYRVTATRDGVALGERAEQALIDFLPFRADSIEILYHDAYNAVVTDNFALLHIWNQGDAPFDSGATREVVFIAKSMGVEERALPTTKFTLLQNYPNPFTRVTTIPYYINHELSRVNLKVYDITGRIVKVLVDEYQNLGSHKVRWDGTDEAGKKVANGVYFYRLSAGDYSATDKLSILR